MPWLLKCVLLGSWAPCPGFDFIFLTCVAVLYCYARHWVAILERISIVGFIAALMLAYYKDAWFSLIGNKEIIAVADNIFIGLIAVKITLTVSMLLFFCARWAALLLKQEKEFNKKFKQSRVSMAYAVVVFALSSVCWWNDAPGLALPLMMPFWYVGHVYALKCIRLCLPKSWIKPVATIFYYLLLLMALLTDVLLVLLMSGYMSLGVYQSFRDYRHAGSFNRE